MYTSVVWPTLVCSMRCQQLNSSVPTSYKPARRRHFHPVRLSGFLDGPSPRRHLQPPVAVAVPVNLAREYLAKRRRRGKSSNHVHDLAEIFCRTDKLDERATDEPSSVSSMSHPNVDQTPRSIHQSRSSTHS